MPSKRSSVLNRSPDRGGDDDDDDDSGVYLYPLIILHNIYLLHLKLHRTGNSNAYSRCTEMSSDEGSALDDRISTPDREYNNIAHRDRDSSREHSGKRPQQNLPSQAKGKGQSHQQQQPTPSDTSSAGSPTQQRGSHKYNYDQTDISDFQLRSRKFKDRNWTDLRVVNNSTPFVSCRSGPGCYTIQ